MRAAFHPIWRRLHHCGLTVMGLVSSGVKTFNQTLQMTWQCLRDSGGP